MRAMSKVVTAEYDAEANVLRLVEPLEGIPDHAIVDVEVMKKSRQSDITSLSGSLSKEAAESLAKAVNELFPPWD
jgi:hypothetical protein